MHNNPQIIMLDVGQIQAKPNNARKHSKKQIAMLMAGIEEFGFRAPVIVDKAGHVLSGHVRIKAAQKLTKEASDA